MKHLKKYESVFDDVDENDYKFTLHDEAFEYIDDIARLIGSHDSIVKFIGESRIKSKGYNSGYSSDITYWSLIFDDGLDIFIYAHNQKNIDNPVDVDLNDPNTIWYVGYNEYDWKWSDKIYVGRSEKEVMNRLNSIFNDTTMINVLAKDLFNEIQDKKMSDYIKNMQKQDRENKKR